MSLFTLRCPLCASPLAILEREAACPQGHRFDRAKEGYFNLLPVHKKNSLNPGDDADMVVARRLFLETGFYAPFRHALTGVIAPLRPKHLLDSGCGEGWYTQAFCPLAERTTAFDISKEAVRRAAKRERSINWLVASSHDIPVPDESVDVITAIFSPVLASEAARVLKPGGALIIAAPGEKHLWELREALYDEVRPHQAEKWIEGLGGYFDLHHETGVRFDLDIRDANSLGHLLKMTPHYWRASREKRNALEERDSFVTQADFRVMVFKKR